MVKTLTPLNHQRLGLGHGQGAFDIGTDTLPKHHRQQNGY
jgi:hypothetical protein